MKETYIQLMQFFQEMNFTVWECIISEHPIYLGRSCNQFQLYFLFQYDELKPHPI